jgi:hypothetical protein
VSNETDTSYCDAFDLSHYINCDGLIGDFVWHDLDCNGIQDFGEPGLEGVRVTLKLEGVIIAQTYTDANGYYEFPNLCAGNYRVNVAKSTLPPGIDWVPTIVRAGSDRAIDSNPNPENVPLKDGQVKLKVDFGFCEELVPASCYIDIEKHTNGVDADTEGEAVGLFPGNPITWTYYVTNTGPSSGDPDAVEILGTNIVVEDDQLGVISGPASGDVGSDGILSPGETWTYEATGTAMDLGGEIYENVGTVNAVVYDNYDNPSYCQASDLSHYENIECGSCVSQFTEMTFQYLGTTAETIEVIMAHAGEVAFSGVVQPGELFTAIGQWAHGGGDPTLGTEIDVFIDGVLNAEFHTSCSDPEVVPGLVRGDLLIINIKDWGGWVCTGPG